MRKEFGSQDCSYMSFPDMICSAEAGQKAELGGEATRPGADSKMSELVAWPGLGQKLAGMMKVIPK
jgi:hypothetical protein